MKLDESIFFEMIASTGEATALYMEAISCARNNLYKKAIALINEGEQKALDCHRAHAKLITAMANNEKIEFSLLLVHAEDQMMNCEILKLVASELIDVYKKISNY